MDYESTITMTRQSTRAHATSTACRTHKPG